MSETRPCRDCPEGSKRPAPKPGPRCVTHHREVVKARRELAAEKRRQKIYGLEEGEYELLLAAQGGVCAICLKPPVTKRLAVDHDHKLELLVGPRGSVRGLVHGWENTILGRFGDDPEMFERAADYLRNPPARRVLL